MASGWVRAALGALVALALVACGDDDGSGGGDAGVGADAGPTGIVAERPECENLDPTHCLMPYPSSRFLVEDEGTETGWRVQIDAEAFPLNQFDSGVTRTDTWNRFDGFSPMTSLIAGFFGKVDPANLADASRIADSLLESSPTVLLDAETGERVAHFAEIDEWRNADPDTTSFYIRPATRLKENHRYIAAIRDLTRVDGSVVEPSEYFRALRDGETTDVDELEARRETFEGIFSTLAAAGVARDDLILAWDFRTASGASLHGDMLAARADAFQRFEDGTDGVGACTVTEVEEDVNDQIWRRVTGTFTVPLYVDNEYVGARMVRGEDGAPAYNGVVEAPFQVVIPPSVRDRVMGGGEGARMLMYGHGLLGSADQVSSGGTRVALERFEMVGFGTDYWGLAENDEAQVLNRIVTQYDNFDMVGERLVQGTINSLLLQKAFKGACAELPELQLEVGGEPTSLVDPEEMYYYGISQGGIMGGTLAALSDEVDRYVLQVGAIGYSIMLRRSVDFDPFERVFELWYTSKLDRDWFLVSTQAMWDLAEPATYAPHVLQDPLADDVDTSAKRVLYQTSLYDAQVPNVASDVAARTMGLPWYRSGVYEPWGTPGNGDVIEATDGPTDSGYIIYHLTNVEPIPTGSNIADEDNDAHNDLRFLEPMLTQLDEFCRPDGQVRDTCPDGSCAIENTRR
ncbi:MAG TPA: hypothetical protein RMH85_29345 [Polyangiaceae bacterium LLY-WYZ-15_(1-7)]|nr:hypothetical protein [Polyangiaceae bacterium LLY-WYZ-15_(1-7)]HJL06814.1 hypothetical protein [Polyangiaceae bacterium LLY-WYZ-15_(1-7)]HJL12622.1 hypothetical protein [Polyangiaceae bacterium LLY-WYZ-15_(1-7)]HJL22236.1 hypothetical protein [Polyangiaceae bacterium LLY-WYZ-15_(1-7)]HJL33792.1 hypothetical protein [Polyangiaceae bacterium LLY-WYZ-15_(1-7)]